MLHHSESLIFQSVSALKSKALLMANKCFCRIFAGINLAISFIKPMNTFESEHENEIRKEIEAFITGNRIPFYELKTYAYNNDKNDWLNLLRSKKHEAHIKLLCKRNKRFIPFEEAYREYIDAQANYKTRHTADDGTWKE